MREDDWIAKLKAEGYQNVYTWSDSPETNHPDHTHSFDTAHVILSGAITVNLNDQERTYKTGDRFDIPKGIDHSAHVGVKGCKYIIAEK